MSTRLKIVTMAMMLAALACSIPLIDNATVVGSGDIVTVEESISGFDRLDISHTFDVDIIQSQTYSLVVELDDNLVEYLVIEQRGDTLVLSLEDNQSYNRITLKALISMPTLRALEASGASDVKFTQFSSSNPFDLDVSGASSAEGDIEAGDVSVDISGASDVVLSGSGGDLKVDASGAGEADLEEFPVNDADLDLSGASDVTVNVSGTLDVRADGASEVKYVGSPTFGTVDVSGGSTVQEK